MRFGVLVALAALLSAGCISSRRGIVRQVPPWTVGVTTPKDVVASWGNPDFIQGDDWVWWSNESIGGKLRMAYMGVGVTVSNDRRDMLECRLRFGKDGKLTSMELLETMPGGAKWSLLPTD